VPYVERFDSGLLKSTKIKIGFVKEKIAVSNSIVVILKNKQTALLF
jgi:hypothetical protein